MGKRIYSNPTHRVSQRCIGSFPRIEQDVAAKVVPGVCPVPNQRRPA